MAKEKKPTSKSPSLTEAINDKLSASSNAPAQPSFGAPFATTPSLDTKSKPSEQAKTSPATPRPTTSGKTDSKTPQASPTLPPPIPGTTKPQVSTPFSLKADITAKADAPRTADKKKGQDEPLGKPPPPPPFKSPASSSTSPASTVTPLPTKPTPTLPSLSIPGLTTPTPSAPAPTAKSKGSEAIKAEPKLDTALTVEAKPKTPPPMPSTATSSATSTAKAAAAPIVSAPKANKDQAAAAATSASAAPAAALEPADDEAAPQQKRRSARRRPAGPPRVKLAANDDMPSIGGLIYALDQKPSNKPFKYAAIATGIWTLICAAFAYAILSNDLSQGLTFAEILARPTTFLTATAILAPIAVMWFLALLAWRSDELRLRSSTMTEVAIRLAEPDRMAEQSAASVGQAVRRQVSFMNDAISRALGRAGELEALVHNEVSALERSYEENERKIRGLIKELSGERNALLDTSDRVADTLKTMGTDIPALINNLANQQQRLATIIEGAGQNLTSLDSAVTQTVIKLETSVETSSSRLETSLERGARQITDATAASAQGLEKTLDAGRDQIQGVLDGYTGGLAVALDARTEQLQTAISGYVSTLDTTLTKRTDSLQKVFADYTTALDTTLATRAEAIDMQVIERTKALDAAFQQQLITFDDSIMRSTSAIDSAITNRANALTQALESHAKTFGETIARQSADLDESLVHGITAVRRTSENITRQSLKAIEGLAQQSEMLKNVSQNILGQINTVTTRFENQGNAILQAANALENANVKIDSTLQSRHNDMSQTLERLSGKADEFGRVMDDYSSTIEGKLGEADARARMTAAQLLESTENTKRIALSEIQNLQASTDTHSERALADLRQRFSNISDAVNSELTNLTSQFDQTSSEVRGRANTLAREISDEQARLRAAVETLPTASKENTAAMRRALTDQIRAIEQLSELVQQNAKGRDISLPEATAGPTAPKSLSSTYADMPTGGGLGQSAVSNAIAAGRLQPAPGPGFTPTRAPAPLPAQPSARGDGWSLGDLLKRASRPDDDGDLNAPQQPAAPRAPAAAGGAQQAAAASPNSQPMSLQGQIEAIARSIDPGTAAAIWSRLNNGQRGVMARSIYGAEGRAVFDDISARYKTDPQVHQTIERFLQEFERLRTEAKLRDPSGRALNAHLVSEMGRVYLFLAHVSGRIT